MSYVPDEDMDMILESQFFTRYKKEYLKTVKAIRTQKIQSESSKIKKSLVEEKGVCEICGFSFKPVLQIHHILPISMYGNNRNDNLICVCPNCHKSLHVLYKMTDKGKNIESFHMAFRSYDLKTVKALFDICEKYILKRGEVLDFLENHRFDDPSKE